MATSSYVILLTLIITTSTIFAQEQQYGIIEIRNKTQIHCVSEHSDDMAMFTSPPLNKAYRAESLLDTGIWKNDDWLIMDSSNVRAAVLDSRWEDFTIDINTYKRFVNLNSSLSFSVYGTNQLSFFVDDGELLDHFVEDILDVENWTTYTVFLKDNNVHYYINNKKYFRKYLMEPTQIVIKTRKAEFKFHNYKYKEATTATSNFPTSLIIPQSNKTRLMLYVSLCKSCVLEVKYGIQHAFIESDSKENSDLQKWQTYKIDLNPRINEVQFIRKKYNEAEKGYWRLDARLHDSEIITAGYVVDDEEETYRCKYLSTPHNSKQERRKRHIGHYEYTRDVTNCSVGMLGATCNISCSNVLGQQYPQCQQHKICTDAMNCKCAWGYHGHWCENICYDGMWGMNCENTCVDCISCNKLTGRCSDGFQLGNAVQWILGVSLPCVFVLLIIVTGHLRNQSSEEIPETMQLNA